MISHHIRAVNQYLLLHVMIILSASKSRSRVYRFPHCIIVVVLEYCLELLLTLERTLITVRWKVAGPDTSLRIHITLLSLWLVIHHNLVRLLSDVHIWEVGAIVKPIRLGAAALFFITFWDIIKAVLSRDSILLSNGFGWSGIFTQVRVIIATFLGCRLFLRIGTKTIKVLSEVLLSLGLGGNWTQILLLLDRT